MAATVPSGKRRGASLFDLWFPMPQLLFPRSVGIDISDASIKWMGFEQDRAGGYRVFTYGTEPLAKGVVSRGVIQDKNALSATLQGLQKHMGSAVVHVALPEEPAYIFSMHVPAGTPRGQVMRLIEFDFEGRVPISPSVSVYDFDVIGADAEGMEIGVSVFPRDLAEIYVSVFDASGMMPVSLEIEARSIARAVSSRAPEDGHVQFLIDFGRTRTGFSVLKNAIPIFTSTVEIGSARITDLLKERLSLSEADADKLKNDEGLLAGGAHAKIREEVVAETMLLAEEVVHHFHFWDTRRDEHGHRMTPVGKVILVGGGANLKGLADFLAGKVHAPVERGDVWCNIFSFDESIPPIERRTSLQFATAVGLALRGI